MDWLDYREKLGIGFDDEEKKEFFYAILFNLFDTITAQSDGHMSIGEYFTFCRSTGSRIDTTLLRDYCSIERFRDSIRIIKEKKHNLTEFLAYYVFFVNAFKDDEYYEFKGEDFKNVLCNSLEEAHIPYELMYENDKYFIFPKGAKELDDALVSEPLEWLKDYPQAHRTYCIALKQYADGIYIRDVADNLRKALEDFLREFLGNNNDFNKNKKEVENYLKSRNADSHLITILVSLLNHYYLLNNEVAKHNDKMDKKYLEFLLYQTGIFIRNLITVKREEEN
ncbi:MAG: hypothetical protein IKB93_01270 [Clostridia bacterium]|nr:hypothetical protein [Clostridia bacterium]